MTRLWALMILLIGTSIDAHEQISADSLWSWLAWPNAPLVVDVRENGEWQSGHIPQAILLSWNSGELRSRWRELPRVGGIVLVGDERSQRAAANYLESLRDIRASARIYRLQGGMAAWNHPVTSTLPAPSKKKPKASKLDLLGRLRNSVQ
jgi:rhodanese-related sulfurtransferase